MSYYILIIVIIIAIVLDDNDGGYYYYYYYFFLFNICTGSNCPGNKTLHNFSLDERVIGS